MPAGAVEEKWNDFKSIVYKVCKGILDIAIKKHKDWFVGNEELINNSNLTRNNMHTRISSLLRPDIEHSTNLSGVSLVV